VLEAGAKLRTFDNFPVLVVGVEALSQGNAFLHVMQFLKGKRAMAIVDESSRIKNYDAIRTERCWEIGEQANHRMALTGTSVTQGLQDLYAQMRFVDPTIIGELSYYSFRNKYCIMGGFEQRKIVGYNNVEELLERIRPYCDVIRKEDMKGMPPKSYQVREVKASPAQVRACKELARDMKTTFGDKTISVQNALEALLRFQQIAGGFEPDGTPLPTNPKLTELVALLEDFDGKALIWARYLPELDLIETELEKNWPGSTLKMNGTVKPEDRQPMVDQFQTDPKKRFFIANQSTGGIGLTLTAATLSVYFSNTFSLEDRLQSEDRNHRIGQENAVLYVDLVSDLRVDRMLAVALSQKKSLSDFVQSNLRVDDLV
jgi:SNF2 family DNA or RNA helicase